MKTISWILLFFWGIFLAGCLSQDAGSPLPPGKRRLSCSVQLPRHDDPDEQYLVTFIDTEGGRPPIQFEILLKEGTTAKKTISSVVDSIVRLRTTMTGTMRSKADVIAAGTVQVTIHEERNLYRDLKAKALAKAAAKTAKKKEKDQPDPPAPPQPPPTAKWEESSTVKITSTPPQSKQVDYMQLLDALQETPPPAQNAASKAKNSLQEDAFDYNRMLSDMMNDIPPPPAASPKAEKTEDEEEELEPGYIWVLSDGSKVFYEELPEEERIEWEPQLTDLRENGSRIFVKVYYSFSVEPRIEWPLFTRRATAGAAEDDAMRLGYLESFLIYPGDRHIVELPGEPQ